jgi:hypothetical protein
MSNDVDDEEEDPVAADPGGLGAEAREVRAWAHAKSRTFPSRSSCDGEVSCTPSQRDTWGESIWKHLPDASINLGAPSRGPPRSVSRACGQVGPLPRAAIPLTSFIRLVGVLGQTLLQKLLSLKSVVTNILC